MELPVPARAVTGREEPGDLVVSSMDPVVEGGLERAAGHARNLDGVRHEIVRARLLYVDGRG